MWITEAQLDLVLKKGIPIMLQQPLAIDVDASGGQTLYVTLERTDNYDGIYLSTFKSATDAAAYVEKLKRQLPTKARVEAARAPMAGDGGL
jgi:hypothetical protein